MRQLADDCVQSLDTYRARAAEGAQRMALPPAARRRELRSRYGYPYVLDEWRFHMTSSDRLRPSSERDALIAAAREHFRAALA